MSETFDSTVFFEKEYEKELKVKEDINNNITNILTMLAFNLTIFSYLIINMPLLEIRNYDDTIAFIVVYLFGWCFIIYSLNIFIHFYNYYSDNCLYKKIPYSDKLNEYFKSLEEYEEKEKYINEYLLSFYIDASTWNSKINEYRSDLQYKIRKLLFINFIILIIIFIAYYVIMNGELNIYTIKIKE
ncbi:hypothetical protein [Halarcobacter ebronensis]|uniref:Uncharacterized protein n=1 Tax=Halarcobacter ebronensis TaxID=1462615 RepID=A0A4Q1ATU5_9BACT|nr:hypothetical protein [Halarcobacter ebronensis]QKF80635.1 putative membrane protein [Halarcobacter ebronensis]RXK08436.1 hypothetical protein CRV07_01130 [Halarcobacter ebronensis]